PAPASAAATAAPSATPAAPGATPGATVDQVCAGSGNFLARDFCRMRECGKPSFASDPVCVRFRQMDEARRQQSN
ncbi:MAG: serine/threonine protein kinase, partial [Hydrogenophaga sp.]